MELSAAEITAWISRYFWPFCRVGAFFMVVPIIGTQLVPTRIRLGLSLLVTIIIAPLLPEMPTFNGLDLQSWLLIGQQILTGVAMAFVIQLLFHVVVLAGQMMAMQMGLGFASMVDPTNGVSVAVVSQFYLMLVMLVFFAVNGHLVLFEVLAESFNVLPVGTSGLDIRMFWQLASWGVWMFSSALVIALPAVTAILIVNFTFGIMTRASPQMNIFALGFPFTMLLGLLIIYISLTGFLPQFQGLTEEALLMLRQLIGA